ncbi:hypothetical protein NYA22BAC_02777 [Parasphingorhabdus sp. NYA22]
MSRSLFLFIQNLSVCPFVLSLSKDASRRDVPFDKLSVNGSSRREPLS